MPIIKRKSEVKNYLFSCFSNTGQRQALSYKTEHKTEYKTFNCHLQAEQKKNTIKGWQKRADMGKLKLFSKAIHI